MARLVDAGPPTVRRYFGASTPDVDPDEEPALYRAITSDWYEYAC